MTAITMIQLSPAELQGIVAEAVASGIAAATARQTMQELLLA